MGELAVTSKNEAPTSPFGIAASTDSFAIISTYCNAAFNAMMLQTCNMTPQTDNMPDDVQTMSWTVKSYSFSHCFCEVCNSFLYSKNLE